VLPLAARRDDGDHRLGAAASGDLNRCWCSLAGAAGCLSLGDSAATMDRPQVRHQGGERFLAGERGKSATLNWARADAGPARPDADRGGPVRARRADRRCRWSRAPPSTRWRSLGAGRHGRRIALVERVQAPAGRDRRGGRRSRTRPGRGCCSAFGWPPASGRDHRGRALAAGSGGEKAQELDPDIVSGPRPGGVIVRNRNFAPATARVSVRMLRHYDGDRPAPAGVRGPGDRLPLVPGVQLARLEPDRRRSRTRLHARPRSRTIVDDG
jgi:hypothetical protein